MSKRIPWNEQEITLLFRAYECVTNGTEINTEAIELSKLLRELAVDRGILIDDTFRNINGIKMQLANVQHLFTDGKKGLSGASTYIREMYQKYQYKNDEYQRILKETIQLISEQKPVENAFFDYAKSRINLTPEKLREYLGIITAYCHLKQPLLGMTDLKEVRKIQQTVAEGKLLRYQYGERAQVIRKVSRLYYSFVKSYRKPKAKQTGETQSPDENLQIIKTQETSRLLNNRIIEIVTTGFPNGIRPSSIIDTNKLKRLYLSRFGEEITPEVELSSMLVQMGIRDGEKVYILTDVQKQSLKNLVLEIFARGYNVIYYSELLFHHTEILESCHLFEMSLMRIVFSSILPDITCKKEKILKTRDAEEIKDIEYAYGETPLMNYHQIKERCPYLTLEAIRLMLSRSDLFVWSSSETFAQVKTIILDENEIQEIRETVIPRVLETGYFSLNRLRLDDSCALNPNISVSAIRDAMFIRHMMNQCDRCGLVATPKGKKATTVQLLEAWCHEHEEFAIKELEEYERELTGRHAILSINIAYNNKIRVDHDHFVSDKYVQFNVAAIDHAISLFVVDRIIPITAITSFTSFPDVPGYAWNLYLVDSFLRRFSACFSIEGGPAQRSYVGAICQKEHAFETYEDRLAHAVIQDDVPLNENSVGRYLKDNKFILRRNEIVNRVLEKARYLREQRGDKSVWV